MKKLLTGIVALTIAVGCGVAQAGEPRVTYNPNGSVQSINGRLELPSLEPGGGGTIQRCVSGYITRDPHCGAPTSAPRRVRRVRR